MFLINHTESTLRSSLLSETADPSRRRSSSPLSLSRLCPFLSRHHRSRPIHPWDGPARAPWYKSFLGMILHEICSKIAYDHNFKPRNPTKDSFKLQNLIVTRQSLLNISIYYKRYSIKLCQVFFSYFWCKNERSRYFRLIFRLFPFLAPCREMQCAWRGKISSRSKAEAKTPMPESTIPSLTFDPDYVPIP